MRDWGECLCLGEQEDFDGVKHPPKPTQILALRSPTFVQTFNREGGDSLKLHEMKKMSRSIRCLDSDGLHWGALVPLWSHRA